MIKLINTIFAALLICVNALASDVTITSRNLDGESKDAGNTKLYFTADRILIENQFKNEKNSLIFSSSKKEFIFIDHGRKEYYQVTEAELRQFIGQLKQMVPMMKAFMGNLPPEQQEKLKKQFGSLLGEEAPQTTFNKTASGIPINKWSTDKYDALQGGTKIAEMFLASYGTIGVSKDDFKSFEVMRDVFGEVVGEFSGVLPLGPSVAGLASNLEENPAFENGVPVRSVTFKDGSKIGENIVETVSKKAIDQNVFTLPNGYARKKLEMPQMR